MAKLGNKGWIEQLREYPMTQGEAFQPEYVDPVDSFRGYPYEYPAQWEMDLFAEVLWEHEGMSPEEDDIWEEI